VISPKVSSLFLKKTVDPPLFKHYSFPAMKSKITTEQIAVTTIQEKKTVNIEMTFDEAALLFCLIGQMEPPKQIENVELSIQKFHPQFSYLLKDVKGRVGELIYGLYDSLKETLGGL